MNARRISLLMTMVCWFTLAWAVDVTPAEDWRQFRGPDRAGATGAKGLPTEWSAETSVRWKTELPGKGASSPIVVGDQVIVTCYSGYGQNEDDPGDPSKLVRHVASYDLKSGQLSWTVDYPSGGEEKPFEGFQTHHGYASPTPSSDGEAIFTFLGRDGVVALALDGTKLWQTSVGENTNSWGSATSPVLYDDLVIVNASVESGSVVGLRKSDGEVVWKYEGIEESWSSPLLVDTAAGTRELIVAQKGELTALDPASGKELWSSSFVDDYICPSPIAVDGMVYAIGGRRSTAVAVQAGGAGEVELIWEARAGANVGSPVHHEGHLYFLNGKRGMVYCLNAQSGEVVYSERLSPRPGTVYASPLLADGKLYFVTREAGVFIVAADPSFQILGHNEPLDESHFNASPAVAANQLLIRSDQYLYCLQ